ETGENDVQFKVMYCGICHTDLHQIKNEWGITKYPIIPGQYITWKTGRKLVGGSAIGGVKEIQEMVYFAEKHNITPNVEVLPMEYVNTAVERLVKSDVKYRFVLDIGNTLKKS
ncbi:hypothetical protein MTR67_042584, partial [Solanum verrucosum]